MAVMVATGSSGVVFRPRLLHVALSAAFVLFFLWDYYLVAYGVRPFEIAGLLVLAVVGWQIAEAVVRPPRHGNTVLQFLLPLALLFAAGAVRGIAAGNVTSSLVVLVGFLVFWAYYTVPLNRFSILRLVNALLVLQLVMVGIHWLGFVGMGTVLNFHAGPWWERPRVYNEGNGVFRPAGLFLEPNSYSLTTFTLVMLRYRLTGRRDLLFYLALGSMVVSRSFWGIGIAAFTVFMLWARRWLQVTVVALAAAAVLGGLPLITLVEPLGLKDRIENIGKDASALGRYKVFFTAGPEHGWGLGLGPGFGISPREFQDYAGANAFSYFVYAFGLVGFAVFVGCYGGLSPPGARWLAIGAVLVAMTSFPLWSYGYWWAWLGLLAKRFGDEEPGMPEAT